MDAPVVSEATAALLRTETRRFVTQCGTRRALPTLVHVGEPAGDRITITPGRSYDAGLRADLLTRALDRLDEPAFAAGWLTRGGFPTAGDQD
ncbi:MAG: hypothetical protein M3Y66_05620, partial [Actinomycetota bacterium]|nr:hypothetical protein [Actinomycetota bacterium]